MAMTDLIERRDVIYEIRKLREEIWMEDIPSPGDCREYQEHHQAIQRLLNACDAVESKIREMKVYAYVIEKI